MSAARTLQTTADRLQAPLEQLEISLVDVAVHQEHLNRRVIAIRDDSKCGRENRTVVIKSIELS